MTTVMLFFAAMAVIIAIIFYVGYRVDRQNAHKREENTPDRHDPLDPANFG